MIGHNSMKTKLNIEFHNMLSTFTVISYSQSLMVLWLCSLNLLLWSHQANGSPAVEAVYQSVSCRQEVCRNTEDSLQLMNAYGHISDRVLKVVKNLVQYIASQSVISLFMYGYNICVLHWHNCTPYCTFVHLLCQNSLCCESLPVTVQYLCTHMLRPTHGEQRDFFTEEM